MEDVFKDFLVVKVVICLGNECVEGCCDLDPVKAIAIFLIPRLKPTEQCLLGTDYIVPESFDEVELIIVEKELQNQVELPDLG